MTVTASLTSPEQMVKALKVMRQRPDLYARQVLGAKWWAAQVEVARAVVEHPRVLVRASHSVGKTHLAGGLVNWFFDCWAPSITLTTAPTQAQVEDLLWKEVRVQRRGRKGLLPKAPRMSGESADHFAAGYTANTGSAFQGRHESDILLIFDEAVGVGAEFWDAAEGMMTGPGCRWLAIMNPTDTSSRAYEEELRGGWHVITINALCHPNIRADLDSVPAPYPAAVRAIFIDRCIENWCTPIHASDRRALDIEWRGSWYRPGPLFESRVLGRWPSQAATSVWTQAMWDGALISRPVPREPLEIGVDVARFGDDYTSIVARRGPAVLHHETHNGWNTSQTAGGAKAAAKQLVETGEDPQRVAIKVDDDGVGGGVTDQSGGWNFQAISGASRPVQAGDYPNRRSELWFSVAERADRGELDLSRLTPASRMLIRRQVMMPTWRIDAQGRRVVEPKSDTKRRLGRSPDDADALNLAFAAGRWAQDRNVLEWLRTR